MTEIICCFIILNTQIMAASNKTTPARQKSATEKELSTDLPISEKDEVKKAEENTGRLTKNQDADTAVLKNKEVHNK